jgi:hypothetical protein
VPTQQCSTEGCDRPAAFRTTSKPAWCLECIDDHILRRGLRPLEGFVKPKQWRLCICVNCNVKAHYQFQTAGSGRCTACEAMQRANDELSREHRSLDRNVMTLLLTRTPAQISALLDYPSVHSFLESGYWPADRIARHLAEHNFDLLENLVEVNDGNFPVVAQCRSCLKIRAARIGDLNFGCLCSRNTRSSAPARPRQAKGLGAFQVQPDLILWWNTDLNDNDEIPSITARATRVRHWQCPTCDYRFLASVAAMVDRLVCPACDERDREVRRREARQWDGFAVADVPPLAAAWADDADPNTVLVGGRITLYRFSCSKGHFPRVSIGTFMANGCAHCRAALTMQNKKFVAEVQAELASQWHPTRNKNWTPANVGCDSTRQIWWQAECCGAVWEQSPRDRDTRMRWRCEGCKTILDSLAWHNPELAKEWSPTNTVTAWQVRPTASVPENPEWICLSNPDHVWSAALSSRSSGSGCPECRPTGKSGPEIAYLDAALDLFGNARSGISVRNSQFTSPRPWSIDILVDVGSHRIAIEYDGAYWHGGSDKREVDERKTRDLLAAGYPVVRLREYPLALLAIEHPVLRQIRVYPATSRTDEVMHEIADWARSVGGPPLP